MRKSYAHDGFPGWRIKRLILALSVLIIPTVASAAVMPVPLPCNRDMGACWKPPLTSRWQYQLQGDNAYASTDGINLNITSVPFTGGAGVQPTIFYIDLYAPDNTQNTAAVNAIRVLNKDGERTMWAICYLSAGTWEPWRLDADKFPASLKGKSVSGFRNEKWLDIRRWDLLGPIMQERAKKCRDTGFDGIEWDNVDGYTNETGFSLKAGDQLFYNANIANLAHAVGLTVALKNDIGQASQLLPYFDYAINEQCQQYKECGMLKPFVDAGKAVFQVEYNLATSNFCPAANSANRNAILKTVDLFDTAWTPCR